MKVYDIVAGLTDGGSNNPTQMPGTYMYSRTFQYNNVGMGTAAAVVMVPMMLVVIVHCVMFTAREGQEGRTMAERKNLKSIQWTLLAVVPVMIVCLVFQRYFVEGLAGAVKG